MALISHHKNSPVLYYIHDPMCSWCWGFSCTWMLIKRRLPSLLAIRYVLGGLAADSDEPMPKELQVKIEETWRSIQKVIPGVEFNYEFWQRCQPRRSTYPACRAVLAAKKQDISNELKMIEAIQKAYYLQAKNPSDEEVLISLSKRLGMDEKQFACDLNSIEIKQQLKNDIALYHQLSVETGMSGFPSLILKVDDSLHPIPRNYVDAKATLHYIAQYYNWRENESTDSAS